MSAGEALPPPPFLYPLTDTALAGQPHAALVQQAAAGGARIVQMRAKHLGDGAWLLAARAAVAAARAAGVLLVLNDRVDLALLAGASGVHVGGDDLPVAEVRRLGGPALLIGTSTHAVDDACRAADGPADYVALGPIYRSSTKTGRVPLGPDAIRRVKERAAKPLVAIGGIGLGEVAEVVAAGADGVAVIGAVMVAGRVEQATRALLEAIRQVPRPGSPPAAPAGWAR